MTKTKTPQSVVMSADGGDFESEPEPGEGTDVTPELPKQAEFLVPSTTDTKKAKVCFVTQLKFFIIIMLHVVIRLCAGKPRNYGWMHGRDEIYHFLEVLRQAVEPTQASYSSGTQLS
jgi:hypothetical protein